MPQAARYRQVLVERTLIFKVSRWPMVSSHVASRSSPPAFPQSSIVTPLPRHRARRRGSTTGGRFCCYRRVNVMPCTTAAGSCSLKAGLQLVLPSMVYPLSPRTRRPHPRCFATAPFTPPTKPTSPTLPLLARTIPATRPSKLIPNTSSANTPRLGGAHLPQPSSSLTAQHGRRPPTAQQAPFDRGRDLRHDGSP